MTAPNTSIDPGAPFSEEAEQAVIGSCLIDPSQFVACRAFLKPDDFFLLRHQYIWQAMCAIDNQNEPLDMIVLSERLENSGTLDHIGGRAYLTLLTNNTGTSVYAEVYARLVERTSIRRQALIVTDELKKSIFDESITASDAITPAINQLLELSVSRDMQTTPIADAVSRHMDIIEARQANPQAMIGLATGYSLFDFITKGLQQSRLYVFAGATKMGKSAWMANIALKIARRAKIAWFTYENSEHETITRFASILSGVPANHIESGTMNPEQLRRYTDTMGDLGQLDIHIEENMALNPMQLRAVCRRLQYTQGLDAIFVDYLQLIPSGVNYGGNREVEVAYIVRELKALASELKVPVITAAQINRDNTKRSNKRPNLTDLRESAAIEQTADVVGFIHSDFWYYQNSTDKAEQELHESNLWDAEIIIAAQRNGGTGICEMKFNRECTTFIEVIRDKDNRNQTPPPPDHYADEL